MTRNRGIIIIIILIIAGGGYLTFRLIRKTEVPPGPFLKTAPFSAVQKKGPPLSEYIESRPPLTSEKEKIKQKLVAPLGEGGTLFDTSEYRIDYLGPFDVFQVEIKTTSISLAKGKVVAWFKRQGFNEEDICNLPVTFYLSGEVAQKFQGSGLVFNPLPDFCQ